MILRVRFFRGVLAVLLCAGLNGCFPANPSQYEEEKESHYLAGKSCLNTMDYEGAAEAFEKAVEVNPHSSAAHLQLGLLYEDKLPDPAAAVYHYEQYLKLCPKAENMEWIKQRISNCKLDLAKVVQPLPVPPGMQREVEKLAAENKQLHEENEQLKTYCESLKRQLATNSAPPIPLRGSTTGSPQPPAGPPNPPRQVSNSVNNPTVAAARTYLVQPGDTLASIAKKCRVRLDALMKANPGVDPKKLRVGKPLNLPAGL